MTTPTAKDVVLETDGLASDGRPAEAPPSGSVIAVDDTPAYTHDQIALVAYYYWRLRETSGSTGNAVGDWAWANYALLHESYEHVLRRLTGN